MANDKEREVLVAEFAEALAFGENLVQYLETTKPEFNAAQVVVAHYTAFKALAASLPDRLQDDVKAITDYVDRMLAEAKPVAQAMKAAGASGPVLMVVPDPKNTLKN